MKRFFFFHLIKLFIDLLGLQSRPKKKCSDSIFCAVLLCSTSFPIRRPVVIPSPCSWRSCLPNSPKKCWNSKKDILKAVAGLPFPNYSISKHLSQINKWWALKPAKQNTISFYFLKLPEGPPDPLLLHRASKCNSSYISAQKLPSNRSTVTTSQQFIHVKPRASTLCQISLLDERWSIAQWLAVARLAKEAIFGVTADLDHKSTALFVHWVHVVFPPCAYIWAVCTGCALFIQSKPEAFCTETREYIIHLVICGFLSARYYYELMEKYTLQ